MAIANVGQKFSQTHPSTTIYWHTCKFTRKRFCSPVRRLYYSKEGERLKAEQDLAIREARKLVCLVYFFRCPETNKFFTTLNPYERYSEEGKQIVRERQVDWQKEYRTRDSVQTKEAARRKTEKRKASQSRYVEANRQTLNEQRKQRASAKPKPAEACRVYFIICRITGKLFAARTKHAKYSNEVRATHQSEYGRRKYEQDKDKVLLNQRQQYEASFKPVQKHCKNCNSVYITTFKSPHRNHCSVTCLVEFARLRKQQNKGHQHRARKYGVRYEAVNVKQVFERDSWTCQLCGVATPKALRGTIEANAPELDHIIPLSKGGPHIVSNVQCACRKCNGLKGDKLLSQLPLFI